jgi:hypothetical protein
VRAEGKRIAVRIAWSAAPGTAEECELRLPAGATVADAIAAWRLQTGVQSAADRVGIWGRRRSTTTPLVEGDRVEIYRPLQADPMEARRARQRRQGAARRAATCNPKR